MTPNDRGKPPLIVIAGPTAVGKTSLAIELARRFDGEIVNADSRSFYRGMDIGTAKPSAGERLVLPHHLIDILEPDQDMSLSTFQQLAFDAIDDVTARHRLPFLVGGSAQYLAAIVENWRIPQVPPDPEFRATLEAQLERDGVAPLIESLRLADPDSLDRTGPNPRRIIRALEVHHATGRPMSRQIGKDHPRYDALQFELWMPREVLHERISARIQNQFQEGFVEEVRTLLARGIDPTCPAFSSIGYREIVAHIRGETSLEQTIESTRHASNRLVRHQQTWFRKNPAMTRIDMTDPGAKSTVLETIASLLDPGIPQSSCE